MDGYEYDIKAIPTTHNGTKYRSRLEARWGAFFDLLGWQVQYEPFDLDGWAPDFLIDEASKVLVEVKPCLAPAVMEAFLDVTSRYHAADYDGEALAINGVYYEAVVVGSTLATAYGGYVLGKFNDDEDAVMNIWKGSESKAKNPLKRIGFCNSVQSFQDRITGCYDGGSYGLIDAKAAIRELWAEAGNQVQWKPGQR